MQQPTITPLADLLADLETGSDDDIRAAMSEIGPMASHDLYATWPHGDAEIWSDVWQALEVIALLDGVDPDLATDVEALMEGIDPLTAD